MRQKRKTTFDFEQRNGKLLRRDTRGKYIRKLKENKKKRQIKRQETMGKFLGRLDNGCLFKGGRGGWGSQQGGLGHPVIYPWPPFGHLMATFSKMHTKSSPNPNKSPKFFHPLATSRPPHRKPRHPTGHPNQATPSTPRFSLEYIGHPDLLYHYSSSYHGISGLLNPPEQLESFFWAYMVLGATFISESVTLVMSINEIK